MKSTFAHHGISEKVVSDNGPCYSSAEFHRFADTWGFTHSTSGLCHPQSNSLTERTVQMAKIILDQAKAAGKDPYIALLDYRNTPVDNYRSPAQLLMSRRLRSILPVTKKHLQPEVVSQNIVREQRKICQQHQQQYFNRGTKPLPQLPVGAPVSGRRTEAGSRQ